ncbi:MAG: ATP-dependent DNA ligase [Candidatus Micrarchaeota archaeon]|nr:ATP-dependent DNA ligase [Candidatus Micrarchaeota archaeon]
MRFSEVASVWSEVEAAPGRLEMADYLSRLFSKAQRAEVRPLVFLCSGVLAPPFEGLELGIGEKLVAQAIALVSGRSPSELDAYFKKSGDWGLTAEWALGKKKQTALFSQEQDLHHVYDSLVKLAKLSGAGSQDAKIKTLAEMLNSSSGLEAKYVVRFCVGKMRLGVAEPTILDALTLLRVPLVKESIRGIETRPDKKKYEIKMAAGEDEKKEDEAAEAGEEKAESPSSDEKKSARKRPKQKESETADATLVAFFSCDDERITEIPDSSAVDLVLSTGEHLPLTLSKLRAVKERPGVFKATIAGFKKAVRAPVERAYNLCSDLGLVSELALFEYPKIRKFELRLFSPVRPALAERLPDANAILEKIGPCAVEGKYDGFRLQVHKDGPRVELYSRKLERVTPAFPEVVEAARLLPAAHLIFEGEALAYNAKEKRYYSFQTTIQRKRKYGVEQMSKDFPLRLFAFDLLYADGVDWTAEPYSSRRDALERLVKGNSEILPSELKQAKTGAQLQNFFEHCLAEGLEGIIAKDLSAPYVPGAREYAWIKLKKSYGALADTLDTIIVGYYLGEGARAAFNFGGLLVAVRNEQTGMLETVARIGSGFNEEEMAQLAETLGALKVKEKPAQLEAKIKPDFWVEPKLVATVSADEITLSPMHTCGLAGGRGYALRFPRLVQLREDKGVDEATTTSEVEKLYSMQKNKGK